MEENFEPVARTRANYYTPGSPVQFVCVELLKGEVSGEHAVCLTFKNISRVTLTALEIHFKCKGVDGVILCEDEFEYRDLTAKPGESFGMDDAVFVTQKAITSVDVTLRNVYSGRKVVHLESIKRVRLPAPRRLSVEMQKALEARMNRTGMKFMPQVFENGWYCACGAFHPKEEDTVYCSECGSDRILLQNALNTLLQPEAPVRQPETEPQPAAQPVRPAAPAEEPTRIVGAEQEEATRIIPPRAAEPAPGYAPAAEMDATRVVSRAPEQEATRVLSRQPEPVRPAKSFAPDEEVEKYGTRVVPSTLAAAPSRLQAKPLDEEDDCEEEDPRDSIAETLIRWVPPITAIVCAGIALCGFVYSQFMM